MEFDRHREEGGLLTDMVKSDIKDKIKMLEKENENLKWALDNKFNKEKELVELKLTDEIREKKKL